MSVGRIRRRLFENAFAGAPLGDIAYSDTARRGLFHLSVAACRFPEMARWALANGVYRTHTHAWRAANS
eukprot:8275257-Alexandrium_andersonii.AAC.1